MKYLIMTIMLAVSTVNAGENVASAIDEYINDNPEVVLPILVGGGVSTAGVVLTIGAMAGAVMLPVASRDMLPRDAALADLPTVSTAYPDKSSTAVSPIICSKALENSAIVSGVTVAIVSPTAAPATSNHSQHIIKTRQIKIDYE
jgi:hypothetical protein